MPAKRPPELEAAIAADYRAGKPVKQIMAEHQIGASALYALLERYGARPTRKRGAAALEWSPADLERIGDLRRDRASVKEIAAALGADRERVSEALRRLGLLELPPESRQPTSPRELVERALGSPLQRGETVHHRNGDTTDNRLINLMVRKR